MSQNPAAEVTVTVQLTLKFAAEGWESYYDEGHPLTPETALEHLRELLASDTRGGAGLEVVALRPRG